MMNQATISISTDDLYTWAKGQGALGIAVLFVRAFENKAPLTPQLVAQAEKVRARQIADGKYVPVTEHLTRRPPVVETVQPAIFTAEDETILAPARKRTNPWPGIYTVEHEEGHSTFRVKLQPSDAKFAPGATLIELLVGQDNTSDYSTFGFVRDGRLMPFKGFRSHETLLERANAFLRNPEAALVSKHCARCGHVLTTPESIAAGLGSECRRLGLR
jgi:hypothetical protein